MRDNHHIRRGLESDSVSLTAPLLRSSHLSPPAILPLQPCSLLCPSSSSFLSFPPVLCSFFKKIFLSFRLCDKFCSYTFVRLPSFVLLSSAPPTLLLKSSLSPLHDFLFSSYFFCSFPFLYLFTSYPTCLCHFSPHPPLQSIFFPFPSPPSPLPPHPHHPLLIPSEGCLTSQNTAEAVLPPSPSSLIGPSHGGLSLSLMKFPRQVIAASDLKTAFVQRPHLGRRREEEEEGGEKKQLQSDYKKMLPVICSNLLQDYKTLD